MAIKNLKHLEIETISSVKLEVARSLPLQGRNSFRMVVWLTRGNGSVTQSGQTRGINPNTLIYVPADTPYEIHLGQNPHGMIIGAPQSEEASQKPFVLRIRQMSDQTKISSMIDVILAEKLTSDQFSKTVQDRQFDLLMISVQRMALAQSATAKETASQMLMRKFADLTEANLRDGKSIAWYAKELGVSTAHLSRVCQAENHKPASRYLQARVLSEAKAMLRETDLSIAVISAKLHFSTPAYFSRLFSDKIGKTPREYRKDERAISQRTALTRYG